MKTFRLITWNIQWGRGCDGRVDLKRIVKHARALADFDVLCLQEVANNYPGLAGSKGEDQPALLAKLLPQYTPIFCAATDAPASNHKRKQFGNMMFSRLPVGQVFRHLLPWRIDASENKQRGMQRALLEAVIKTPAGHVRVMTTHLEYYSRMQRAAQIARIYDIHTDAVARAASTAPEDKSQTPFRTLPGAMPAILCGDFNMQPDDAEHQLLMPAFCDAWRVRYADAPHPPTIGVFDKRQWKKSYCCDYVYVTEDLRARVRNVVVDQESDASDHQAILLELNAGI